MQAALFMPNTVLQYYKIASYQSPKAHATYIYFKFRKRLTSTVRRKLMNHSESVKSLCCIHSKF